MYTVYLNINYYVIAKVTLGSSRHCVRRQSKVTLRKRKRPEKAKVG